MEIGVDGAYTRPPMSSLTTALHTKRTIEDEIEDPRNIKQRTAEGGDWAAINVASAPR